MSVRSAPDSASVVLSAPAGAISTLHMAGYSTTPLAKKLGIQPKSRIFVLRPPAGYRRLLDGLPEGVKFVRAPSASTDVAHAFCTTKGELLTAVGRLRRVLSPDAVIWISWPKKSSGLPSEITEDAVRDAALPLGLVDVKVCAVDAVWSGLKLVVRKEFRSVGNVRAT